MRLPGPEGWSAERQINGLSSMRTMCVHVRTYPGARLTNNNSDLLKHIKLFSLWSITTMQISGSTPFKPTTHSLGLSEQGCPRLPRPKAERTAEVLACSHDEQGRLLSPNVPRLVGFCMAGYDLRRRVECLLQQLPLAKCQTLRPVTSG